jgi:outer membrane biosynthesis protein TonB
VVIRAAGFSAAESTRGHRAEPSPLEQAVSATVPRALPPRPSARSIANGGFGDATVATPSPLASAKPDVLRAFTPVEILNKPRPRYSEEARPSQIEGEVLVEMLFGASGRTPASCA